MSEVRLQEWPVGTRLLSAVMASLLWLSVLAERPGELRLTVPVRAGRIPAGLAVASRPADVAVTVSGPRILLLLLPYRGVTCRLDLASASAGENAVVPQEDDFRLPDKELKVVRVDTPSVKVTLSKAQQAS